MIIPQNLHVVGNCLLTHMLAIPKPTSDQLRFIGSLKKAMGQQSNNEKRKQAHR